MHARAEPPQNSNDFPLSHFSLIRKTKGRNPSEKFSWCLQPPLKCSSLRSSVSAADISGICVQRWDVHDENNVFMSLKRLAQICRVAANSPRRALSRRRKCFTVSLFQMAERKRVERRKKTLQKEFLWVTSLDHWCVKPSPTHCRTLLKHKKLAFTHSYKHRQTQQDGVPYLTHL